MVFRRYVAFAITLVHAGLVSSFQNRPTVGILSSRGADATDSVVLFSVVDVKENAVRDIQTMEGWAYQCGVQGTEGLQLMTVQEMETRNTLTFRS